MTSVLGYARTYFIGGRYWPEPLPSLDAEVARFHEMVRDVAGHVTNRASLGLDISAERLLQGPFADAMTQPGQLALLRRLAGNPVAPENFIVANVHADASAESSRARQPGRCLARGAGRLAIAERPRDPFVREPKESAPRPSWRAYAALAAAVFAMSWSAVFVRWAAVPATASAFYRVLIASAVLVPLWTARGPSRPVEWRSARLALVGGVFFAFDIALFNARPSLGQQPPRRSCSATARRCWWGSRPGRCFAAARAASSGSDWRCRWSAARRLSGRMRVRGAQSGTIEGDLFALGASVFWGGLHADDGSTPAPDDTLTFNTLAIAEAW